MEDYEHTAAKDFVYLLADEMLDFYSSLNDPGKAQIETFMSSKEDVTELKQPATIQVIDQDKMLQKQRDESKINTLPF
jgi:hypothetical protein